MKKPFIILVVTLFIIMLTPILLGCSKSIDEIKLGIYNASEGLANLTIEEDGIFVLDRGLTTSYTPTGNYIIDGDRLLLKVDDLVEEDIIEFKINRNTLIFESGELAKDLIEKGTKFIYKNER